MSRFRQAPRVEAHATIELTEEEMRALDALVGYGIEPFLQVFYQNMGESYLRPHEQGLRSLFETVSYDIPAVLRRADAARKAFVLDRPVIRSQADHDALIARVQAAAQQRQEG
ncbi:hypothetical protein [Bordetella genomosp. 1]|uniref:hypothetical protein n=1 Tax=Bordetella genomosp. 1 TaxID=1395607 RepID=UPI001595B8FE|nr:hypothetical protein [Bordetella genomosp. 1]